MLGWGCLAGSAATVGHMWLWIALGVAVVSGLLFPLGSRLQATGLWVGKALVPPEAAGALPRGFQDAVTAGWPSWFCLGTTILSLGAIALGFLHSWWAALAACLTAVIVGSVVGETALVPRTMDWYLARFYEHANRRACGYSMKGDLDRAAAAEQLAGRLGIILQMYLGSGVLAPTMTDARKAPYGHPESRLLGEGSD